ncbi:MAG TPA: CAP domain-containing protein [Acidimicrobiales bacterium]|nr:CAP domain-containing protein [Acidimicrobiales bacterium]
MPVRRRIAVLGLVALVFSSGCVVFEVPAPDEPSAEAPSAGDPPAAGDATPERAMERAIFDMVNRERQERGLSPLDWDEELARRARQWSADMAAAGRLEHQDAQEMQAAVEGYTALGENIFQSSAPVAAGRIHVGWMRSEGHRVNVLEPGFDRLGVGVVCDESGEVWATQRFGRTAGADRPDLDRDVPPEEPVVTDPAKGPACSNPLSSG